MQVALILVISFQIAFISATAQSVKSYKLKFSDSDHTDISKVLGIEFGSGAAEDSSVRVVPDFILSGYFVMRDTSLLIKYYLINDNEHFFITTGSQIDAQFSFQDPDRRLYQLSVLQLTLHGDIVEVLIDNCPTTPPKNKLRKPVRITLRKFFFDPGAKT